MPGTGLLTNIGNEKAFDPNFVVSELSAAVCGG
jgi:hypothetical protein